MMPLTRKNIILQGSCLDVCRTLADSTFKTVITSSPYLGMRHYGTELQIWDADPNCAHVWEERTTRQHAGRGDGQKSGKYSEQGDYPDLVVKSAKCTKCPAWKGELGQEGNTPAGRDLFLSHLWQICDELKRVLEPDGTLWFNIGDKRDEDGSLFNVPHAFVEGMLKRGWVLVDDVIWFKRSVLPQSDPTKFTPDYEFIFHFAKRDAPTFYANGRLGLMQREVPPDVDSGKEGIDWVWLPIKPGRKTHEKLRDILTAGGTLTGDFKEEKVANEKTGELETMFYKKVSCWQPFAYFHDTQYRPYSEASLKQIEKAYTGKSKKHASRQATLEGLTEGVQDPSDTKRNIVANMQENLGMPRYGGKKAEGYGQGTYSGEPWQPEIGDTKAFQREDLDATGGSAIKGHSGYIKPDGEPCGDPVFGSYERTVWFIDESEQESNFWDIIPARFAEAHFATFPIELVQRCIRASCPEHVCTKCRLGWRKMYSEERKATRPGRDVNTGKSGNDGDPNSELHKADLSRERQAIIRRQVGIMKCRCGAPTEPGACLDPFMGSGTTAIGAITLNRDWLGIELNDKYIELANQRLKPYREQSKL